jgi:hypothetical protein
LFSGIEGNRDGGQHGSTVPAGAGLRPPAGPHRGQRVDEEDQERVVAMIAHRRRASAGSQRSRPFMTKVEKAPNNPPMAALVVAAPAAVVWAHGRLQSSAQERRSSLVDFYQASTIAYGHSAAPTAAYCQIRGATVPDPPWSMPSDAH